MKNLKIGARLALAFGLVVVLLISITLFGINRLSAQNDSSDVALEEIYPKAASMQRVSYLTLDIARNIRDLILLTDEQQMATEKASMDKNRGEIATRLKDIENSLSSNEEKEIYQGIVDARGPYISYADAVTALGMANRNEEGAKMLYGEGFKTQSAYLAALKKMTDFFEKRMHESNAYITEVNDTAELLMWILGAVASLTGALCAWAITRSIVMPLRGAVKIARTVAAGDLTSQIIIDSTDETGELLVALKDMNDSLIRIVGEVREGTDTIANASGEIAQGNQDLSTRTEAQAGALEETASSMEELTSTVRQNADNARQANQLAASASDVAVKGGVVVSQVVETMGSINESAKKIVDIISVIDGIAFQTNILALNAAVEAARAGEQGRGFAVVASEVRNLAQRSAAAAKEIKSLIGDSVEKVDAGAKLVDQAGATMTEIVDSVKRVTDIMAEITAASMEQSSGIEQVNQAITQMDETTQQNAALVEQAAAAAESMRDQAQNLEQVVSIFKTGATANVAPASTQRLQVLSARTKNKAPLNKQEFKRVSHTLATANAEWEAF